MPPPSARATPPASLFYQKILLIQHTRKTLNAYRCQNRSRNFFAMAISSQVGSRTGTGYRRTFLLNRSFSSRNFKPWHAGIPTRQHATSNDAPHAAIQSIIETISGVSGLRQAYCERGGGF